MTTGAATLESRKYMKDAIHEQNLMAKRIKKLVIADDLKYLDFAKKDKNGFVEYEPGLFIRDITSEQGRILGKTDLHVLVKDDIEISSHEHIDQSQMIMVKHGRIYDIDNRISHPMGEVFFIRKKHRHKLKYYANSEYLITFMPQLHEE